ncbi:hypothetical protein [Enterobacter hormaechei]|uniref:Phage tail protein C-terminal domain-containing protein n=1 Tax=Enterobacter hormaechei TaxID=158836 RepID=A0AAP8KLM3_9ENTR|nr:hypothetical protein CGZ54_24595 [Enterobacter hormaechei]
MIYTTGTIAISGNTLTGTGTNFTAAGSLIRNGCTVIAMTSPVQVFQITTIGSATSLTVTPAANPTVPAGTRFAILLSDSLSVDGLAQDIAETFTMYQRYMSGFADVMNGTSDVTITINGTVINVRTAGAIYSQLSMTGISTARMAIRVSNGSNGFTGWSEFYTTTNTTKASDGTLKAASPVARIVKSLDECQRADIAEDGFSWCGCGTANAEAEGIKISRLDVGIYLLTGSAGLASEGWQLLPPMDPGGMGELGVVEAEQTESGGLTIRLFKRKYILSEEGEIVKTKGAPIDVPANSWIDVRLDMPEDSIWNKRQKESSEAALQESAS